ncbi:hypothetical protein LY76DRAFT_33885 [Colletotrichum caudatum]|nr:hypothetical protein LY76DRAFT_33885 [Colletotrichum caudatum]
MPRGCKFVCVCECVSVLMNLVWGDEEVVTGNKGRRVWESGDRRSTNPVRCVGWLWIQNTNPDTMRSLVDRCLERVARAMGQRG